MFRVLQASYCGLAVHLSELGLEQSVCQVKTVMCSHSVYCKISILCICDFPSAAIMRFVVNESHKHV